MYVQTESQSHIAAFHRKDNNILLQGFFFYNESSTDCIQQDPQEKFNILGPGIHIPWETTCYRKTK